MNHLWPENYMGLTDPPCLDIPRPHSKRFFQPRPPSLRFRLNQDTSLLKWQAKRAPLVTTPLTKGATLQPSMIIGQMSGEAFAKSMPGSALKAATLEAHDYPTLLSKLAS
jgi:hypothetical protein